MGRVYLGLGTNLGDREANLRRALRALTEIAEIEAISSIYGTAPVGHLDQPDFLNLVLAARTTLEPAKLLAETQRIEHELGRERSFCNAPRTIDIDLLLYDDQRISTPTLTVPHPRMKERGFVLRPLVEIAPELRDPVTGERYAEVLARSEPLEHGERLYPGHRLLAENRIPSEGHPDSTGRPDPGSRPDRGASTPSRENKELDGR